MLEVPATTAQPTQAAPKAAAAHGGFHEFLSELNPLQYIPVIGTIYRAVTGDTIPEAARVAGGLVVSGLAGGPIGVATNIAITTAAHAIGVDPEKLGLKVLAQAGIGEAEAAVAEPPATDKASAKAVAASLATAHPAWSGAQLAAYGVTVGGDGALHHGALVGADVLNDLELARLRRPGTHALEEAG
jgi:hypothetical protein